MRDLPTHRASRIGTFASDILAASGEADVIAVFERSFYLLCQKGIVAVCLDDLGAGPINILVPARGGDAPWHGVVRDGMKAAVTASGIVVHGGFVLDVSGASPWSPPAWAGFHDTTSERGVAIACKTAADKLRHLANRDSGFASLVLDPTNAIGPTADAARGQVHALQKSLPHARRTKTWPPDALRSATLLVGLGPGLTPSGDDLLGGLMLALSARGDIALRDALFESIVDELNDLTVPVSAMHLTAAAYGQGHETMHALLNAIISGDAALIATGVDAVAQIGATSGFDALAGVVLGLSG
jgi:hypothetical protein